jgi:PAS domain-containing protein
LQQRGEQSRAVLDSLPAGIAVLDKDGTVVATNTAWEGLTQIPPAPVACSYLDLFGQLSDSSGADKVLAGIKAVLEGSLRTFRYEYTRQVRSRLRWFLLHATPLIDSGGAVISQIDVTESKRAEEALRHSEARFRDVCSSPTRMM